jgi:predicted small secreted protein
MKKLLSLVVLAASLTLFSCENNTVNEHEGNDVDTVKTENTEINTNTEVNTTDTTTSGTMSTDTTHTMTK